MEALGLATSLGEETGSHASSSQQAAMVGTAMVADEHSGAEQAPSEQGEVARSSHAVSSQQAMAEVQSPGFVDDEAAPQVGSVQLLEM